MADDLIDEKVGVAVAASAVVFSPRVRGVLHRGAVLGVSGVLMAADAVSGFVRGLKAGVSNGGTGNGKPAREGVEEDLNEAGEGNGSPAARRRRRPEGAAVS